MKNNKFLFLSSFLSLIVVGCSSPSGISNDSSLSTNNITITFDSQGGSNVPSQQVDLNSLITIPTVSKEGYSLEGWYTSINSGVTLDDKWNFFSDRANFSFTLYAKWLINQYTISFETNGGNSIPSITSNYGDTVSKPTNPLKTGYSFSGWFLDTSLTQPTSIPESIPALNLTLYAKYTINQYTITFITNGGNSITSITGDYGGAVNPPENPTKVGHTFSGWFVNSNLTQGSSIPNLIPAANLILYAKWTINQYTISFNTNGGNIIQTQTINYDATISTHTPVKIGYSFAGWFVDELLSESFTLLKMPANNISLFAKWTINIYTISFNTNGGSVIPSITQNYGSSIVIPINPTREGYTFDGWYSDVDLIQVTDVPSTMPAENITIYAKWIINQYAISFELNGGELIEGQVYNYNENLNLPLAYRYGYKFNGWYTDSNLQNIFINESMPAENLNLYASWGRNYYSKVSFGFATGFKLTNDGRLFVAGNYGLGKDDIAEDSTLSWVDYTNRFSLIEEEKIIDIKTGSYYAGVITNLGRLFFWGANNYGQLGDGSTQNSTNPILVDSVQFTNPDEKFVEIAIGDEHNLALTNYGELYTWGRNGSGQTGAGNQLFYSSPQLINPRLIQYSGFLSSETIVSIKASGNNSSFLTNLGNLFVFGRNNYGNLLQNSLGQNITLARKVNSSFAFNENEEIRDYGFSDYTGILVTSLNRVFMWGWYTGGVLGTYAGSGESFSYVPIDLSTIFSTTSIRPIIQVSASSFHSGFLTNDGTLVTWGASNSGERSFSGTESILFENEIITGLHMASFSTILLTSAGRTLTFGRNGSGRFGNGNTNNVSTPEINI
jgi:uncharacterized repeat protein (TIGR02543 family)